MATYEQLMNAARQADTQGNIDDARRLAELAYNLKKSGQTDQAAQAQYSGVREEIGGDLSFAPQPSPIEQRQMELRRKQLQARQDMARQQAMQTYEVQRPDGETFEVQALNAEGAAKAAKERWAQVGPSAKNSLARPDQDTKATAQGLLRRLDAGSTNHSAEPDPVGAGNVADMSLFGRVVDNVIGLDDGVMSTGEKIGALLNKGGESMTMGLIGDEAAGAFDASASRLIPGIPKASYEERRDHYRDQEREIESQHPWLSLGADIGGAVLGPGKGAAGFVNNGKTATARIIRGMLAGGASGSVSGGMEGETPEGRFQGAARDGALGLAAGGGLTAVGQGFNRASRALSRRPELKEAIPTLDSLRDEAKGLYAAAERSGATLPRSGMAQLRDGTLSALKDAGYHPRLHPKLSVVLGEIDDMAATDQPLQRMEQLRRMAGNAASSLEPDERRLASMVIDKIDDAVDGMGTASTPLKQAREVWSRMRRMEAVESIIEDASNSPNFEQALQTKFRALLRNPRRMRGFSQAERDAMGKIARGTATVKSLRSLGSLMAPNSISGAMLTGGAAYATGPAAAAIPAVGLGSKAVANAIIRSQAEGVRRMAGMDDPRRKIIEALLGRANPLAATAGASGTLGNVMGYPTDP